jgi:hypothetical protein
MWRKHRCYLIYTVQKSKIHYQEATPMLGNCESARCVRDVREGGRIVGGEVEEDPAVVVKALRDKAAGGRA